MLTVSWEICIQVKKKELEPVMEQWTGSKLEKGVQQDYILSHCLFSLHAESVQFSSVVSDLCDPMDCRCQASLVITNSWSLLKLMFIKLVMPSNNIILCRPLLLPPIPPSIRVFSNEPVLCIRWPKYWNFSFSICPSNEIEDWFPSGLTGCYLHAVQGTLKSLLQHHSSKASILWCSAFVIVPTLTSIHDS